MDDNRLFLRVVLPRAEPDTKRVGLPEGTVRFGEAVIEVTDIEGNVKGEIRAAQMVRIEFRRDGFAETTFTASTDISFSE